MKVLYILSLLLCVALAAEFRGSGKHPNHPGKCYIAKFSVAMNPGDTYKPFSACERYICHPDLTYTGQTCGTVHVEPPLMLTQDLSKPYPECCPQIKI